MKRTLVSMMFCVPMLALAAEPECSPATDVAPVVEPAPAADLAPAIEPAPAADLAPVTDLALTNDAAATVAASDLDLAAPTSLPCAQAMAVTPAPEPAYVPKTAHDNSPWRFDMNQNGKRMTAEEFDAWMKAKGIRVATGRAPVPSQGASVDGVVVVAAAVPAVAPSLDGQPATPVTNATLPAMPDPDAPALVPVADMVPPAAAD